MHDNPPEDHGRAAGPTAMLLLQTLYRQGASSHADLCVLTGLDSAAVRTGLQGLKTRGRVKSERINGIVLRHNVDPFKPTKVPA